MFRFTLRSLMVLSLLLAGSAPASGAVAAKAAKTKAVKAKAVVKAAPAAVPVVLQQAAASSLKILGDSTLHKWEAVAQSLTISAVKEGDLYKSLNLAVGVKGLKSNENASMDKNMYKALEASKFEEIHFAMASYEIKGEDVTAKGALTIHGTVKDVELKGKISQAGGNLAVKGSHDLLMSDYGIKPPVMMLGTVRVADKVTIAYDFTLEPRP
jgi:polyisoprenoid-binding protein YceI